jgi:hypothetical protein
MALLSRDIQRIKTIVWSFDKAAAVQFSPDSSIPDKYSVVKILIAIKHEAGSI